jgi:hypothetical protein
MELSLAAGQNFMAIGLVPYIPYNLVIGGIIDIVKRNRQLNHTEACTEMARIAADLVNDVLPELITEPDKVKPVKFPEVFRGILSCLAAVLMMTLISGCQLPVQRYLLFNFCRKGNIQPCSSGAYDHFSLSMNHIQNSSG